MDDAISELLDTVRLNGVICAKVELTAPWGFRYAPVPGATFYVIKAGTAWLELAGAPPLLLAAGDYVALPHGSAHVLRDSLSTTPEPFVLPDGDPGLAPRTISVGGGGAPTALVAGQLQLDRARAKGLLRVLPDALHVAGVDGEPADALRPLTIASAREAHQGGPGSAASLTRLAEMLFVQAARAEIARTGDDDAMFRRLADAPGVAAALRLVRAHPAAPWSLAELSAKVGMSRSSFAAGFKQVLGESPMQYVTSLRMARGAELLRAPGLSITEVAFQVGYASEIGFSRIFKRHFGVAPGAYRQSRRARTTA
jgi:AraC-like DNA-binding protein